VVQKGGGFFFTSRQLDNLSAILTNLAYGVAVYALTICNFFLSTLINVLSSVHSRTISRIFVPNYFYNSSEVVSVSSTVSWRIAALNTYISVTPELAKMFTTYIG
jgi:hypothetical protein